LPELNLPANKRRALLLGSEGPGLSADALARVDTHIRIPMHNGIDSLNVAAAAAVACFVLAT
ncbi:MAG: TrmH family RNA methyltransferase, partial [Candidatus Nanopelagicales bacterium]